jgi:hypothetical protein
MFGFRKSNASPPAATTADADRRRHPRIEPPGLMIVSAYGSMRNIADATVLNISVGGAALQTSEPILPGERLSFSTGDGRAPVHCQVLTCAEVDDGQYLIRCRCILGGFDL